MSRKVVSDVVSVVNAGDNLAAQFIQPGQAFYVRKTVAGPGTLDFTENHKDVVGVPNRLLSAPADKNFAMSMAGMGRSASTASTPSGARQFYFSVYDGINQDETAIVFKDGFNANFDDTDAPYLSGSTVILSSLSADAKANSINYMPALINGQEIRLNINAAATGTVKFKLQNPIAAAGYKIFLKDNYLNTSTNITAGNELDITIDRTIPATFGNGRLVLIFEQIVPKNLPVASFELVSKPNSVQVKWTMAAEFVAGKVEVERSSDGTNFTRVTEVNVSNSNQVNNYNDISPVEGVNYYRLKQSSEDGSLAYSEIKNITYTKPQSTLPKISFRLYPNPADNIINIEISGIATRLNIYDLYG
ncbi:MAG: hypothetical protein EOO89_29760, partial [Pedobacter sp.]